MWIGHLNQYEQIQMEVMRILAEKPSSQDEADIYLSAMRDDLVILMKRIFSVSLLTNSNTYPKKPIVFTISRNREFGANVQWTDMDEIKIDISEGTFIALSDIFFRLVANMDFFSFDPAKDGERIWNGCECAWLQSSGNTIPVSRFLNYEQIKNPATLDSNGTFLSAFLEAIPFDKERQKLAYFMLDVAIFWIVQHEESHYARGHLGYLKETTSQGISSLWSSIVKDYNVQVNYSLGLSETEKFNLASNFSATNKVLEWEADRAATRAVFDLFFNNESMDLLPAYCENKPEWLFRLLLVSIGTVIQIIQKARLLHGSAEDYPTPRTRLISSMYTSVAHTTNPKFPGFKLANKDIDNWTQITEKHAASIVGALDDLNTVSELINRDGDILQATPGKPPQVSKTRNQGLMDSRMEIQSIFELFILSPAIHSVSHDILMELMPVDNIRNRINLNLHNKWFKEVGEIVDQQPSLAEILSPYSIATGYTE